MQIFQRKDDTIELPITDAIDKSISAIWMKKTLHDHHLCQSWCISSFPENLLPHIELSRNCYHHQKLALCHSFSGLQCLMHNIHTGHSSLGSTLTIHSIMAPPRAESAKKRNGRSCVEPVGSLVLIQFGAVEIVLKRLTNDTICARNVIRYRNQPDCLWTCLWLEIGSLQNRESAKRVSFKLNTH